MLCTKNVLSVTNNLCTQHVLSRFKLGIFMYWTCNSMNNLSSYCILWVSWCKNKSFWQRSTCNGLKKCTSWVHPKWKCYKHAGFYGVLYQFLQRSLHYTIKRLLFQSFKIYVLKWCQIQFWRSIPNFEPKSFYDIFCNIHTALVKKFS